MVRPGLTFSTLSLLGHVHAIQFLGRVNPATKELTWPGTGVSFSFTGTTASIGLLSIYGESSVDLTIDGGAPTTIPSVSGTSITTPTLTKGQHTVVLRKRSETQYGTFSIGNITTDGTLNRDTISIRKVEIIGDSISVGYGLDGVNPCVNSAFLEDNPKTYGALAATALNASYSVVAWSGRGLTRNYVSTTPDSSPILPELYTKYGANDADGTYPFPTTDTPNAVVINLGTNDFGYLAYDSSGQQYAARPVINATEFATAMVNFVHEIQKHAPNAQFFLMTSPMLSDYFPTAEDAQHSTQTKALQMAIAQIGNKAHLVDWPTQGSDVGCDYHPNAATNAAEAVVLEDAIREALGW